MIFLFLFILPLFFAGVFVKLGALSVWVNVLSVALNFAMALICGFALALLTLVWRQKPKKISD